MEKKQARVYKSSLISDLLNQIPESDKLIQLEKMRLAAKIDDARIAKGWSKGQLAQEMGVTNAVITKWLSGTHNFTSENLIKIGYVLDIHLIDTQRSERTEQIAAYVGHLKKLLPYDRQCSKYTSIDEQTLMAAEPYNVYETYPILELA